MAELRPSYYVPNPNPGRLVPPYWTPHPEGGYVWADKNGNIGVCPSEAEAERLALGNTVTAIDGIPIPSPAECNENSRVMDIRGRPAYACWYPQMGGYAARAVIVPGTDIDLDGNTSGADVYVWHDGEFPFSMTGRPPVELHHCSGEQFVKFGLLILNLNKGRD